MAPHDTPSDRAETTPTIDLPVLIAAIPKGGGEVRVSLDKFKGSLTIDVRLFEASGTARSLVATPKGITLGLARLPELTRALADAERRARELGLIGD